MKKLTLFAAALVLALGLTTCKKENNSTNTPEPHGTTVHITVNVNNGSRSDIDSIGHIIFGNDDRLYVGYDNQEVGELAYSNGSFSGTLSITENGSQPLYFYFMGGKHFWTSDYTLGISDQTWYYPVIACGTSTVPYSSEVTSYTTTLYNQCALVEFTTNEIPEGRTIYISGVRNKVTLDISNNTITPSDETGTIYLHTESATTHRAILLPTTEPMTVTVCAPGYSAVEITIPAIGNNAYLAGESGPSLTMTENHIVDLSKLIYDYEAQDGDTLTGTAVKENLIITVVADDTVTLSNATINSGRIECLGNATLVLAEGTVNSVHEGWDKSAIYVPQNYTLTITGNGSLDVIGDHSSAGIGAGQFDGCGDICIKGGTITATGGSEAAGIGGGWKGGCGTITITSDVTKVTAISGGGGACSIGHGPRGGCLMIHIGSEYLDDCVSGDNGMYVYEP